MNITKKGIETLRELRLNLNHQYLLENLLKKVETDLPIENQMLERKGLIIGKKLTKEGNLLLHSLENEKDIDIKKIIADSKVDYSACFEEWWNIFPSNSRFDYKGKKFTGARGLRVKKEVCKSKYIALLKERKYTHKQFLNALKQEIFSIKEESFRKGENKMAYMSSTEPYLNQGKWESFIEMEELEEEKEKELVNPTDLF